MTTAIAATPMSVYDCIVAVSADIAHDGVAKTRSNQQQNYKFRGIDEVLNALSPLLAKHRLVILPRIMARSVVERESKNGGALFYVTVEAEFDFVSAADGSRHTVKTYGEAMDSADKATNKAMSAAYKYAAFQTFCIPTEGDNDADAHTPEVAATPRAVEKPAFAPVTTSPKSGLLVTNAKVAKTGQNAKGPWTLYAVKFSDGREGTTFSKAIYDVATDANEAGHRVEVTLQGKNIFTLTAFAPPEDVEFNPADYEPDYAGAGR